MTRSKGLDVNDYKMSIPVIVPSNILIKSKVQINVHNDFIERQIHGQIDTWIGRYQIDR